MTEAGEVGRCEWCYGKGWLFNDGTLGYDPCVCNPAPPRQSPPDEESRLRAELAALRAQRDQMGAALREIADRCYCDSHAVAARLALASSASSGPGDRAEKEGEG